MSQAVGAVVNTFTNAATTATNAAATATNAAVVAATNAATNVATTATNAAVSATNAAVSATNAAVSATNTATNAAANTATSLFNTVANTASSIASNVPFLNSLMPRNTAPANNGANKPANNAANRPANNGANTRAANNRAANNTGNIFENIANIKPNNSSGPSTLGSYAIYIFIGLVMAFVIIFAIFSQEIRVGYQYMVANIRSFLNMSVPPDVSAAVTPDPSPVTVPAEAPQDITPNEAKQADSSQQSIVERILPASGHEVFNVSQNKFSYYDAEPLCNALGAELATYEQVKDAWSGGADWCNYGWVKGQMAVYPTQKKTYDKLQSGPADQRGACGTVGVNGGYFENPEFKYGVNCYGNKPSQSAHDEAMLMSEGKAPKTPATLRIDELTAEFKEEADSLFIRPFNDQKWVSA